MGTENESKEFREGTQRGQDFVSATATRHIDSMAADIFEVGIFNAKKKHMLIRVWDRENLRDGMAWLKFQNAKLGKDIYIRPNGEHPLAMLDDLTPAAVERIRTTGFQPAVLVETSRNNFQAWLNHGRVLSTEISTAAVRMLAERFGGDVQAADWRHFGRLAGFTNRKDKYATLPDAPGLEYFAWRNTNYSRNPDGAWLHQASGEIHTDERRWEEYQTEHALHPFVKLHLAEGRDQVYDHADNVVWRAEKQIAHQRAEHQRNQELYKLRNAGRTKGGHLKDIDDFRQDARYGGDLHRADGAYATYATSRGVPYAEIEAAIASRDLSKKGGRIQQAAYIRRTIERAGMERGR